LVALPPSLFLTSFIPLNLSTILSHPLVLKLLPSPFFPSSPHIVSSYICLRCIIIEPMFPFSSHTPRWNSNIDKYCLLPRSLHLPLRTCWHTYERIIKFIAFLSYI
jgi:hypothetical protein